MTKDGAKSLSVALKANSSIKFIDLSQTQLKVYGMQLIAESLKSNKTLKGINLFKNTIDVDGARAIRDLLLVNETLEFIDIGHNRIRQKGIEAITSGIKNAKKSNIKTLGLRLNLINDDGFTNLFDDLIF